MDRKLRWTVLVLILAASLTSGCAAFVQSEFGPPNKDKVRVEDTTFETVIKLGQPDFVESTKDEKIFTWRHTKRISFLGFFEQVEKADLVVLTRNDQVAAVEWLPRGRSMAILGLWAIPVDPQQ